MTAEEYAALQAALAAQAAAYAAQFAATFQQAALSLSEWLKLLHLMYPAVEQFRQRSADLARQFYDSQRQQFHPELPRFDQFLESYSYDKFIEKMEPVRKRFSQQNAPEAVTAEFSFHFVREVENAGRRQIIHAVEADKPVTDKVEQVQDRILSKPTIAPHEARPVQGWARVATGRETCAWCLMLVSRGPVYPNARSAGSKYDSETTLDVMKGNTDVEEFMNQWHPGCDCKIVPVFDLADWPGMEAQKRAEQLWIDAHDDAVAWREQNPDRVHLTGKNKGKPITFYEDQLLALRRRVDNGGINSQEWAALSQAA